MVALSAFFGMRSGFFGYAVVDADFISRDLTCDYAYTRIPVHDADDEISFYNYSRTTTLRPAQLAGESPRRLWRPSAPPLL